MRILLGLYKDHSDYIGILLGLYRDYRDYIGFFGVI